MSEHARVLLLPGLYDSGPAHWQSRWEAERSDCSRVRQQDWVTPRCEDWVSTLERALRACDGPVVLAAHSLACTLVAHWAPGASPDTLARVRGALLVAPSDVEAKSYPAGTQGFTPMPLRTLPFRSIVVASSDDPYVTPERAALFARAWGSELVHAGPRGHLNGASGLGRWPEGEHLLEALGARGA